MVPRKMQSAATQPFLVSSRNAPPQERCVTTQKTAAWQTTKNVGLRKFWPDVEILEAFLMGLKVSFSSDFCVLESRFFLFTNGSRSLGFVVFYFRLVFRSRNFSEITGIAYRTEFVDQFNKQDSILVVFRQLPLKFSVILLSFTCVIISTFSSLRVSGKYFQR